MMKSKKVLVAMSGGVDSSVAAFLLKEKGFKVIGATLQLRQFVSNKAVKAKKVAEKLDIPHYLFDVEDVFKEKIIDSFCKEYRQGRTPNPCIRCNQYIKFEYLLKKAKDLGIEFAATGHYARIEYDKNREKYLLKKAVDLKKDQSYVLYPLRQNQLKQILLPLGDYTKEEVKNRARELALSVELEKESQEICFIPGNDYRKFLKDWIPEVDCPGPILNTKGEILGRHSGLAFYTIGQRKGLGISNKEPLYVKALEPKSNTVFVAPEKNLYQDELIARAVSCICEENIPEGFMVKAKIRYLHQGAKARLFPRKGNRILVKFKEAQRAITPGQAVVFYDGDMVLGGGIIEKSKFPE
ncbi:MAG: tRNA 2-thiouridine(34) synthase MnmA [Candidatus Ratteibacteria bacterium]|nr:tRNA 2-thiouridine(34) synthase MnmA [Candidatus Ratteibacteria bacterium]